MLGRLSNILNQPPAIALYSLLVQHIAHLVFRKRLIRLRIEAKLQLEGLLSSAYPLDHSISGGRSPYRVNSFCVCRKHPYELVERLSSLRDLRPYGTYELGRTYVGPSEDFIAPSLKVSVHANVYLRHRS